MYVNFIFVVLMSFGNVWTSLLTWFSVYNIHPSILAARQQQQQSSYTKYTSKQQSHNFFDRQKKTMILNQHPAWAHVSSQLKIRRFSTEDKGLVSLRFDWNLCRYKYFYKNAFIPILKLMRSNLLSIINSFFIIKTCRFLKYPRFRVREGWL